jgi:hypothetical protein
MPVFMWGSTSAYLLLQELRGTGLHVGKLYTCHTWCSFHGRPNIP